VRIFLETSGLDGKGVGSRREVGDGVVSASVRHRALYESRLRFGGGDSGVGDGSAGAVGNSAQKGSVDSLCPDVRRETQKSTQGGEDDV